MPGRGRSQRAPFAFSQNPTPVDVLWAIVPRLAARCSWPLSAQSLHRREEEEVEVEEEVVEEEEEGTLFSLRA